MDIETIRPRAVHLQYAFLPESITTRLRQQPPPRPLNRCSLSIDPCSIISSNTFRLTRMHNSSNNFFCSFYFKSTRLRGLEDLEAIG